ncbi:MAG: MBL fold metallo-hydrolase [Limnochordia bacterium]|jgi:phosphoribosyl 1,2-cyclic phosphate phosphodiesterase
MRVTFLGTGTSHGVPVIGCDCSVCCSPLPENKRLRPSVWLEFAGHHVVIDTAPEFRVQALRYGLKRLDAVLFSHAHADHVFGFDDIRRFCQVQRQAIPVYANQETLDTLQCLFGYIFDLGRNDWAIPRAVPHVINGPFSLFGQIIEPLTVYHGAAPVTGFRIGDFAYVTDCSMIPDQTMASLRNLDVLVLDALRYTPHRTHLSIGEAIRVIETLRPARAYLTHLCHEVDHAELVTSLPAGIWPAYDGLVVDV